MDSLRIGMVAPPWYPIPPHGYGGIELVVSLLVDGLRQAGHTVVCFGAEGSGPGVRPLAAAEWEADLGGPAEGWRSATYAARLQAALAAERPFDLIHDHSGGAGLLVAAAAGRGPVLHTVHGSLDEPAHTFYQGLAARVGLIAISPSQRASAPELPWFATVPNAVDVDQLRLPDGRPPEPYLLCLARICPEKGQHLAIAVARRTGRPLVLAGKVEATASSRAYFEREIRPHLDGVRVRHVANVAGPEKADLLARASVLLAPVQWPEPFGLSAAEAMTSGTPVVALRQGAMVDLVEPGRTGYLCDSVDEMVVAVAAAVDLDRDDCARVARQRFSPDRMVEAAVQTYRDRLAVSRWAAEPLAQVGPSVPQALGGLAPGLGPSALAPATLPGLVPAPPIPW